MSFKLFIKCKQCNTLNFILFLKKNLYVCSACGSNIRLNPEQRLKLLLDRGSFKEINSSIKSKNILNFPDYTEKLTKAEKSCKYNEAVVTGTGRIKNINTAVAIMNPSFMMGSMGTVAGDKITLLIEYAIKNSLPVIIITASGGARMQEGIFSLMQMAKTSAAIRKLNENRLPCFTLLSDPTTGGVSASFAMLGNIIAAEPEALIGFAGPRVIEQTIRQVLPEGFQKSEFLKNHGQIDQIVSREEQRDFFAKILKFHSIIFYKRG